MNTSTLAIAAIPAVLAVYLPTPVQTVLFIALFVLVIVDFVTGCIRSYKSGKPISSNGMGATVYKLLAYFSLALVTFILAFIAKEVFAFGAIADSLVALVLSFCNIRESYSILENLKALGLKLPKLLRRLMASVEDQIEGNDDLDRIPKK